MRLGSGAARLVGSVLFPDTFPPPSPPNSADGVVQLRGICVTIRSSFADVVGWVP